MRDLGVGAWFSKLHACGPEHHSYNERCVNSEHEWGCRPLLRCCGPLGVSVLEASLKCRAPGLEFRVGVSIDRTVFGALNAVEFGWAVLITVALNPLTGTP